MRGRRRDEERPARFAHASGGSNKELWPAIKRQANVLARATAATPVGEQNVRIKEGAEKVLVWLGHDGLALKKFCVQLGLGDDGTIRYGTVEFQPKQTPDSVTFLPIHRCRHHAARGFRHTDSDLRLSNHRLNRLATTDLKLPRAFLILNALVHARRVTLFAGSPSSAAFIFKLSSQIVLKSESSWG